MKKFALIGLIFIILFGTGCGYIKQKPIILTERRETPEHTPFWHYQGWVIARASLHNHTTFSDGCYSAEGLAQEARNEGISVLAITDHREGRMCLGKSAKFCVNTGGVEGKQLGYEKYLEQLQKLAKETENPIILPGLEVAPVIWNERNSPWLLIKGESWHFVIYDISDPEVFKEMPVSKAILMKPEKEPGAEAFNNFVNYIRDAGGLIFQAHPQWTSQQWIASLHFKSPFPIHLTDQIPRLNGVAVIPEGFNAGAPGGKWDLGLMQYLVGYREEPFWVIGDCDFHCPPHTLRIGTTLLYLKELSGKGALDAIRAGKMIALMGNDFQEVYVNEFSVGSNRPAEEKIMLGKEAKLSGAPLIRFSLSQEVPIKEARLIRNGKVIYTSSSSHFEYLDRFAFEKKLRAYYRVEVIGLGPMELANANLLLTNPIFISW